jgi:hypothetical protein
MHRLAISRASVRTRLLSTYLYSFYAAYAFVAATTSAAIRAEETYGSPADPLEFLFAALPANLLYCRVQKSASTSSFRFILRVAGEPHWEQVAIFKSTNMTSIAHIPARDRSKLLANPLLTRAVVARDPIERFSSGFMDKCVKRGDIHCPVKGRARVSVNAVISELERTGVAGAHCDGHFRTAASMCLLNETLRYYTVVPFDSLAEGWSSVISSLKGISPSQRQVLSHWAREAFDPLFITNERLKRSAMAHRTNSTDLASRWREEAARGNATAASILNRLYKLYADDYALFQGVPGITVTPPAGVSAGGKPA